MTGDDIRNLVDLLLTSTNQPKLNDLQAEILLEVLLGKKSSAIAERLDYKIDYVNQVAAKLWKTLSISLGEPVSKKNVKSVLTRHYLKSLSQPRLIPVVKTTDWGESIDISQFYGREPELKLLSRWAKVDKCRSIGIFGMGGIGKTACSTKLAHILQANFDIIIWRSLRQAPTLASLLQDILPIFGAGQTTDLSIDKFIEKLQQYRCLILLDNIESILAGGDRSGEYLPDYADYGRLLERVCDEKHQSCLVISGREKPSSFTEREGDRLPVRSLQLSGLPFTDACQILTDKGSIGTKIQSQLLIDRLGGNPLALKIVASNIRNLFNNDVSAFLAQGYAAFGSLGQLLDQQFDRLSPLQQQIMYWLAIVRSGITPVRLQPKLSPAATLRQVLEALNVLFDRAAIETTAAGLTQQPVVMEYIIDRFLRQIQQEMVTEKFDLFDTHAAIEATAPEYVRNTQIQLILHPLSQQLLQQFGGINNTVAHIKKLLIGQRDRQLKSPGSGYSAGNLLNLLCHLQIDLQGWDFSDLMLRQAYLGTVLLRQTKFDRAYLIDTVFAETFGSVLAVTYSPDGRFLATGGSNGEIKIWSADDYREIFCCRGHKHWIMALDFSPDSQFLASASDDYTVKLWEVSTGKCLQTYLGHTDSVNAVKFSPDGTILASAAQDASIRLWRSFATNPTAQILLGHGNGRVWEVDFSPDGKTLVSGGEDSTIRIWDVVTGECQQVWNAHYHWAKSVAFSPDSRSIVSGSFDRTIKLWDASTYECLQTIQGSEYFVAVKFSPDGTSLASASMDGNLKIWEIATGKCRKTLFGHAAGLWGLAYHPDGERLVSGAQDYTTKIWDLQAGVCTKTLTGYANAVYCVAVSPDGVFLASSHEDKTVKVWQVASGEIVCTLSGHISNVWGVAFSPNGELIASSSADETIKIWQWQTGKLLQTFTGHLSWVWVVAFSPDNLHLASGSYDQTLKVWNLQTGECVETFTDHTSAVLSIDFSPCGKFLASGSYDNTIRIWNLETGECDRVLSDHQNTVWSVKFSPDGKYLLSGSFDRTIRRWRTDTWTCIQTYLGHADFVKTTQFTPDGEQIVSGGLNGELKIWDTASGECLQTLPGHSELIYSLDVATVRLPGATEPYLLAFTGSLDTTIKVWDVRSHRCPDTWKAPRPYEGMSIDNITGINESQVASLKALGAISVAASA